jgi:hypothetical protein
MRNVNNLDTSQQYARSILALTRLYVGCFDITKDKTEDEAKARQVRSLLKELRQAYVDLRMEYRKRIADEKTCSVPHHDKNPAAPGLLDNQHIMEES